MTRRQATWVLTGCLVALGVMGTVSCARGKAVTEHTTQSGASGVVSAETSTIDARPLTVVSDGVQAATVTVTLRDAAGQPVAGKVVRLRAPGAPGTDQPTTVTDAEGVATGYVSTTVVGPCEVSATGDGVPLRQTVTILFTPQR